MARTILAHTIVLAVRIRLAGLRLLCLPCSQPLAREWHLFSVSMADSAHAHAPAPTTGAESHFPLDLQAAMPLDFGVAGSSGPDPTGGVRLGHEFSLGLDPLDAALTAPPIAPPVQTDAVVPPMPTAGPPGHRLSAIPFQTRVEPATTALQSPEDLGATGESVMEDIAPLGVVLILLPTELQSRMEPGKPPPLISLIDQVVNPLVEKIRQRLASASAMRSMRLSQSPSKPIPSLASFGTDAPTPSLQVGTVFYGTRRSGYPAAREPEFPPTPPWSENQETDPIMAGGTGILNAAGYSSGSVETIPLQPVAQALDALRRRAFPDASAPASSWERRDALDAMRQDGGSGLSSDASLLPSFYTGVPRPDSDSVDSAVWHEWWGCGTPESSQSVDDRNGPLLAEALVAALELLPWAQPAGRRKSSEPTWLRTCERASTPPEASPSPNETFGNPTSESRKRKRDTSAPLLPTTPTCLSILSFLPPSAGEPSNSHFSSLPALSNQWSVHDMLSWNQAAQILARQGTYPCTAVLSPHSSGQLPSLLANNSPASRLHLALSGHTGEPQPDSPLPSDPNELLFSPTGTSHIASAAFTGFTSKSKQIGPQWGTAYPTFPGSALWTKAKSRTGDPPNKIDTQRSPASRHRQWIVATNQREQDNRETLVQAGCQLRETYYQAMCLLEPELKAASMAETNQHTKTEEGAQPETTAVSSGPKATSSSSAAPIASSSSEPRIDASRSQASMPDPKTVIATLQRAATSKVDGVTQTVVNSFAFLLTHMVPMIRSAVALLQVRQMAAQRNIPHEQLPETMRNMNFEAVITALRRLQQLHQKVITISGALASGKLAALAQADKDPRTTSHRAQTALFSFMQELVNIDTTARNSNVVLHPQFPNPQIAKNEASKAQGKSPSQPQQTAANAASTSAMGTVPSAQFNTAHPTQPTQPVQAASSVQASPATGNSTTANSTGNAPTSDSIRKRELFWAGSITWATHDPKSKEKGARKDVAAHVTASVGADTLRSDLWVSSSSMIYLNLRIANF